MWWFKNLPVSASGPSSSSMNPPNLNNEYVLAVFMYIILFYYSIIFVHSLKGHSMDFELFHFFQ